MTPVTRILSRGVAAALAATLPLALTPHADASRATHSRAAHSQAAPGQASLAALLTSDGDQFDSNWTDFDITTEAVLAVVAAKPGSKVALLADGSVPLTAFVPSDNAFRKLGKAVTGHRFTDESKLFGALVKNLGVDTIEKVLMYHVVPGQTITSKAALRSDGARLGTALKKQVVVHVLNRKRAIVFLGDKDHDARDPRLIRPKLDLNQGNLQIAHGIDRVLRPLDL